MIVRLFKPEIYIFQEIAILLDKKYEFKIKILKKNIIKKKILLKKKFTLNKVIKTILKLLTLVIL